jgi:hypothetical protein
MTPPATASSSLDMNRHVRRILVANWIDLGRLSVRSVKDSVYMRGSLQKLPGSDSALTTAQVQMMYDKIKAVKFVKHIRAEFDNWAFSPSTGTWEATGHQKRTADAANQFQQKHRKQSYRID